MLGRKRVLCVDDDEETRSMMSALLEGYGYEAVIVASVSDALESVRSGGLDLCILASWFTDSNGIELCRQIRALSGTPVMFYSAAAYERDVQEGLAAGAQVYLVKPDIDNLKPTIDRLINKPDFPPESSFHPQCSPDS